MKYIRHKTSGHESTVSDEQWEEMKATKLASNPNKTWASGYKVLQDSPDPKKEVETFIPPEVKDFSAPAAPAAEKISTTIQPTSPEAKTENKPGTKTSKRKSQ